MKKDNSIVESKVSMYFEVFVKKIEQITAEKMENKKKSKKRLKIANFGKNIRCAKHVASQNKHVVSARST